MVWANRVVDEYRSVAVFSELLLLLAEIEAPYDALCAVQRLIGDELRHTQLCATVVGWLGGAGDLNIDLSGLTLPSRRRQPAAARALRIIGRELVVAEEESVPVLVAYRDATSQPEIAAVLGILVTDEARHAAAGRSLWRVFAQGRLANATQRARADICAEMAADRASLREAHAATAHGGAGRGLGASLCAHDLTRVPVRVAPTSAVVPPL